MIIYESVTARIQHVEDLILWEGSEGATKALRMILDVQKQDVGQLSIKWDGSPSVVFGRDENGNFIFTDKSGFLAKGYDGKCKTSEQLESMLKTRIKTSSEGLSVQQSSFISDMKSLFGLLEKSTPSTAAGFFIADVLYFNRPTESDGEYTFKPNIVTYSVKKNSELGIRISKSEAGIVIHKHIKSAGEESSFSDYNIFHSDKVLVMKPTYIYAAIEVDKSDVKYLASLIKSKSSAIDSFLNVKTLKSMQLSDFQNILYAYLNNKVDSGLVDIGKDFTTWLKNYKTSDNKKQKISEYISKNAETFYLIWHIIEKLMTLKDSIINQLNVQDSDVKTYIGNQNSGEGYVYKHPIGTVKFVPRKIFTAANRSAHKITEGGNVFKDQSDISVTKNIKLEHVIDTVKWLESITGLPLTNNLLGSTGIKSVSGDIDLAVDQSKMKKDELIFILSNWVLKNREKVNDYIKKSGDSVHFKTPILGNIKNGYVQTDFMFGDPSWMKWSMSGESEGSNYKGMYRHVLIASIAKYKNLKWSYKHGLVDRKNNDIITKNPDVIAQILIGDSATGEDLLSFSKILNKIKTEKNYEKMVSDARQTLLKYGVSF
jgi:hypothetical protein